MLGPLSTRTRALPALKHFACLDACTVLFGSFWSGWVFVGVEWEEGMFPVWCPCVVFHNIARRCRVRWSTWALATCQLSTKSLTRSLWMLRTISNEIRKWRCCFAAYANENHMFWQQEFLGLKLDPFTIIQVIKVDIDKSKGWPCWPVAAGLTFACFWFFVLPSFHGVMGATIWSNA